MGRPGSRRLGEKKSFRITFARPAATATFLLGLVFALLATGTVRWFGLGIYAFAVLILVLPASSIQRRMRNGRAAVSAETPTRTYLTPRELPLAPTLFVGREREMDAILGDLKVGAAGCPRIIILLGEPGIGKTSLALKVAYAAAHLFPDGQLFADVRTDVGDDAEQDKVTDVLTYFVRALEGPDENMPIGRDGLISRFRALTTELSVLFIFDDATSIAVVQDLLPVGARCAVVVTSRVPLDGVAAVRQFEIGPLKYDESWSVLGAVAGQRRLDDQRLDAEEIVRVTKGHPLSIRTAATGLAAAPHARLGIALARLAAMRNGQGSVTAKQTSLDLSYALLTDEEQRAVQSLAQLPNESFGPWMLAAVLDVDEPTATRIADRLNFAGFVVRTSADSVGVPLFKVPPSVYEMATARIGAETESAEGANRLTDSLARRRGRDLDDDIDEVFDDLAAGRLKQAIEAARQGVELAREKHDRHAEGLALAAFALVRAELGNFDAADDLAETALALDGVSPIAAARAHRCLGRLNRRVRRIDDASKEFTLALNALGNDDPAERVQILRELAVVQSLQKPVHPAEATVQEAVDLCAATRRIGERHLAGVAWAQSVVFEAAGRIGDSRDAIGRGRQHADRHGQKLWLAWLGHRAAVLARNQRADIDETRTNSQEAIVLFGEMNHRYGKAHCRLVMGHAVLDGPHPNDAVPLLDEALENVTGQVHGLTSTEDSWSADRVRVVGDSPDSVWCHGFGRLSF